MLTDKLTKSIAEAAKKCMDEELKGNQPKIDEAKYEPAAPDPELIAKRKAREAAERRREEERERKENEFGGGEEKKRPTVHKVAGRAYGGANQKDDVEESVQIDEMEQLNELSPETLRSYSTKAKGQSKKLMTKALSGDDLDKDAMKKAQTRFVRGSKAKDLADKRWANNMKESFSGLLESYKEGGIKALFENLQKEEASEEEFNAELKKQKDKAEGKAPQADVAAAATQGTKDMKESTHTEVEVVDMTDPDNIHTENIELEERTLTSGETAEKERIVKGMKKGIEGFKQRYGERAKEVMYATATKKAKED